MNASIPTPEEMDILNEKTPRPILTDSPFITIMAVADAVHAQLEDLTPPEALEVLKVVTANLKAEVRDFNEDHR